MSEPVLTAQWNEAMRILKLHEDPRCAYLAHMRRFYEAKQHDKRQWDWDGKQRDPGVGYLMERLKPQGFIQVSSVAPIADRKPNAPIPLAKQIVTQFTDMLVGEGRQPTIRCRQDDADELYIQAVFKESQAWDVLTQARDVAGACGSAVIVAGVIENKPYMEVLYPEHCWVPTWKRTAKCWKPLVLVHQTLVSKTELTEGGALKSVNYWQTRAWDEKQITIYEQIREDETPKKEGLRVVDVIPHNWGTCPVVWYQNTRSTESPDGESDCEGTWPLLDRIDQLNSQGVKATIGNADPTLVLKDTDRAVRKGGHIKKGSNNVIPVGPDGDAKYLEITGSSIEAAFLAIDRLTQQVLQTTRCVVPTPELVRSNESGEARQILWRSMESRANRLRVGFEAAVVEVAKLWRTIVNKNKLDLDDQEVKTPEGDSVWKKPTPGSGKAQFTVEFPPYWAPTAMQLESFCRGLSIAAGAVPVLSYETAARHLADYLGSDPDIEVQRIAKEKEEAIETAQQEIMLEGQINLPNGPKPDVDQKGQPSAANKPKPADSVKKKKVAKKD